MYYEDLSLAQNHLSCVHTGNTYNSSLSEGSSSSPRAHGRVTYMPIPEYAVHNEGIKLRE